MTPPYAVPNRESRVPRPWRRKRAFASIPSHAALNAGRKTGSHFQILAERALHGDGRHQRCHWPDTRRRGDLSRHGWPAHDRGRRPDQCQTGLTGLAIRRQMSQWCSDTESDARVDQEVCRQLGVRSIIVVPVLLQDCCGWRVCDLFAKSRCFVSG